MKKSNAKKKNELIPKHSKQSLLSQEDKKSASNTDISSYRDSLAANAQMSEIQFFKDEAQQTKALKIPINNPDHFKSLNIEEMQRNNAKSNNGSRKIKDVLMDHLKSKYDEIQDRQLNRVESKIHKQMSNFTEKDSDSEDDETIGFVETRIQECQSTKWLDWIQDERCSPSKVMEDYKNHDMLPQVFGLSSKGPRDILLRDGLTHRHPRDFQNPQQMGERYRKMNIKWLEQKYYIIFDDTTEIKKGNETSMYTASISVLEFDPKIPSKQPKLLFQQTLAEQTKLIFFNSVVMGHTVYFFAIDQLKTQEKSQQIITLQLKKLDLNNIQNGGIDIQKYRVQKKHSITSVVLSRLFQEGKSHEYLSQFQGLEEDSTMIKKVYLGISRGDTTQTVFETQIYKLHNHMIGPFEQSENPIDLEQLVTIPEFLLVNTSSFQHFVKGHCHKDEVENRNWEVHEDFLALNGWNDNTRDKITQFRFIEVLEFQDKDKLESNFELNIIPSQKLVFEQYMKFEGSTTNFLVRYFRNCDCGLTNQEHLHQRIPELNIIDEDPETLNPNVKKVWPEEFSNVCETLYKNYMGSLPHLEVSTSQLFITQAIFDNIQSKYFIVMSYWAGEKDEMILFEIKQPMNHLKNVDFRRSAFHSEMDKNLISLMNDPQMFGQQVLSKFTISKSLSNVIRSQTHLYVSYENKQGLNENKFIHDKTRQFEKFNSAVFNVFRKSFDLQQCMAQVSGEFGRPICRSVAYCEEPNYFFDFKTSKYYDVRFNEYLEDEVQLVFKEYRYLEEIKQKGKSPVELIAPKLRFVEDDRWLIPFVAIGTIYNKSLQNVTNVWFIILDLRTFKVTRTVNLNLTYSEQLEIDKPLYQGYQLFDQITLCPSKSCAIADFNKHSSLHVTNQKCCFQEEYHIGVLLQQSKRIKIFEFALLWNKASDHEGYDKYKLVTFQIGQKEIFASSLATLDSLEMIPKLDKHHKINSTQILVHQKEMHKERIARLQLTSNFSNFNYWTQNDLLKFGYKIYRLDRSRAISFIQVDCALSDKIAKSEIKEFADFIYSQFLGIQLKTILNMIPYDFIEWATRDMGKIIRFFRPLQLLQGQSQIDFVYRRPHRLKRFLDTLTLPQVSDFKYMTLLEKVTFDDPERQRRLRQIGILCQHKEMSHDFYQSNCLERCFTAQGNTSSVQLMNSADLLIEHMLKFKPSELFSVRNMLVAILPYVTVGNNMKDSISKQYIKFFLDQKARDRVLGEYVEYDQWYQTFEQQIMDPYDQLPKFMEESLTIQQLTLTKNQYGEIDLEAIVKSYIKKTKSTNRESNFEVKHSFIDLRQINLNIVRQNINEVYQWNSTCSEYLLSDCILKLVTNYFDQMGQCKVITNIINNTYEKRTRKYFLTVLIIYIVGFMVPFLAMIFSASKPDHFEFKDLNYSQQIEKLEKIELNICLTTQCLFFIIELIQLANLGSQYFRSIWNWVDISNLFLYVAFYYLRQKQIQQNQNKIFPISFLQSLTPEEDIKKLMRDFDGKPDSSQSADYQLDDIAEITIITIVLIFTIIMKMFSLLRIFTSIGQFLEVFYKIVFSTQQFLAFFMLWVITFAFLYMVLGVIPDDNFDYDSKSRFEIFTKYVVFAWSNSVTSPEAIGEGGSFWSSDYIQDNLERRLEKDGNIKYLIPSIMHQVVSLFWLFNIILLLIILLNMLISIVSVAYSDYYAKTDLFTFRLQAELNQECNAILTSFPMNIFLRNLGVKDDLDCIIISSQVQRQEEILNDIDDLKDGLKYMVGLLKDIKSNQEEQLKLEEAEMLHQTVLNTIQHPQEESDSGSNDSSTEKQKDSADYVEAMKEELKMELIRKITGQENNDTANKMGEFGDNHNRMMQRMSTLKLQLPEFKKYNKFLKRKETQRQNKRKTIKEGKIIRANLRRKLQQEIDNRMFEEMEDQDLEQDNIDNLFGSIFHHDMQNLHHQSISKSSIMKLNDKSDPSKNESKSQEESSFKKSMSTTKVQEFNPNINSSHLDIDKEL